MQNLKLVVYSDYVCPWCYIGQHVIDEIRATRDVELEWRPFFLWADMPKEGMPFPEALKSRVAQGQIVIGERARSYGMKMVFPDFIPNSRLAFEATEYAAEKGKAEEFHKIVFRKYQGEGQNIGDWAVLADAAREAGLDAEDMKAQVESGAFVKRVDTLLSEAHGRGITGVPTYFLEDKVRIVGAQGFEVFQRAIAGLGA